MNTLLNTAALIEKIAFNKASGSYEEHYLKTFIINFLITEQKYK